MRFAPLLFVLLIACPEPEPEPPIRTGGSLFAEGCPEPGRSLARVIGVDDTLPGEAAVGTAGDLLLANEHAAFVITDTGTQSTYWYYPGVLADATTVDDCTAAEDKLDELGFVFVVADIFEFEQSILRAFRADTVEVLNDGSDGGAAIVRARGEDDIHWLVEHTLIKAAASSGGRPYSEPYGADIVVDYILEPGSNVLFIDLSVTNLSGAPFALVDAALFQHGATMDEHSFSSNQIEIASLNLDAGLPWIVASDGDGAYALGVEDGNLATVTFSGVQTGVDINQLNDGFSLAHGARKTLRRYFSVGDGDGGTAIEPLLAANPTPLREQEAEIGVIDGTVADASGAATAAHVLVQARGAEGGWGTLYRARTDSGGGFRVVVPEFTAAWDFRLIAQGAGRDDADPVEVDPGDSGVALTLQPHGTLAYAVTNDAADGPGRIQMRRDDGRQATYWVTGSGTVDIPPGTWDWTVTRGYEWSPATGTVTVPDDGEASIEAPLTRAFDTTGWISVDTHVHSSDSPDSREPPADQLLHAAAHGLDIVVHTEHEHIVDRRAVPVEAELADWVNNVIGEEVTSIAVEHMTMFPAEPTDAPRGGYVEWYGLDIDQLFAAMRERSGDGVNLINHPGWLDDIGWDRVAGAPTLADPTLLGFEADAPLWSWNLDGIEVQNGHANVFIDGNRRWDNWMSMVNHGAKMIAVGCSDAHGPGVGFPRTYVRAPSDAPADLDLDDLTNSFRTGQATVSAGAFATITLDGVGPGEQVTDTDGEVTIDLTIQALEEIEVTHFVAFVNCDQVASVVTVPDAITKFDGEVTIPVPTDGDAHIVVAAFGSAGYPDGLPSGGSKTPRAMTNPVYVDGDGDGEFTAPGGHECSYALGFDQAE